MPLNPFRFPLLAAIQSDREQLQVGPARSAPSHITNAALPEMQFEFLLEQFEGLWCRMLVHLENEYVPTLEQNKRMEEVTRAMLRKAVDL